MFDYNDYFDLMEQNAETGCAPEHIDPNNCKDFTKLNLQRMKRWNKKNLISNVLKEEIRSFQTKQEWTVLTETWCGDAAHVIPVLKQITDLNPNISLNMVLRDENPELMDQYLYKGTRSIPRLISKDMDGNDLFVWGPRPARAQEIMDKSKEGFYDKSLATTLIQKWYNQDKGQQIIREIMHELKRVEQQIPA